MRMIDVIVKKRDGGKLSKEELEWFVNNYVSGDIPDYEVAALLMAIYFSDLDDEEMTNLTLAMAHSGKCYSHPTWVDKHSTGGVGDKTTLIVAPIVAACGGKVGKCSGRALGLTGGTADKLSSISRYKLNLTMDEFTSQVERIGIADMEQTSELVPADKLLYHLRDVTGTVENISLIASSIMSKKIAGGAGSLVLDVKCGRGAFMKDITSAKLLAQKMIAIAKGCGIRATAVITDMDEPLGNSVGNAIEVGEAMDLLKSGNGDKRLVKLCLTLSAYMLKNAGLAKDFDEGYTMSQEALKSGMAWNKFNAWIAAQGGDLAGFEPYGNVLGNVSGDGYIAGIDASKIAKALNILGMGRNEKDEGVDLSVGVKFGETCATVYGSKYEKEAFDMIEAAIVWGEREKKEIILEIVE